MTSRTPDSKGNSIQAVVDRGAQAIERRSPANPPPNPLAPRTASGELDQLASAGYAKSLSEDVARLAGAGTIKPDYLQSPTGVECVQEMLRFLDESRPDQHTYSFMRRLFLALATSDTASLGNCLPQQYLRIARTLNSGEALLLQACARMAPTEPDNGIIPASQWLQRAAAESGLEFPELVEQFESSLMARGLLTTRQYRDNSGVRTTSQLGRLTQLGGALCSYLEKCPQLEDQGQKGSE